VSLQLAARIGRDLGLERVSELVANFERLWSDFAEFFPQLQARTGYNPEAGPGAPPERRI
jgi:hypothetical protein